MEQSSPCCEDLKFERFKSNGLLFLSLFLMITSAADIYLAYKYRNLYTSSQARIESLEQEKIKLSDKVRDLENRSRKRYANSLMKLLLRDSSKKCVVKVKRK